MQRSLDLFAPWLRQLDLPWLQTPAGREFCAKLPAELPTLGEAGAVYARLRADLAQFQGVDQTLETDLAAASAAVTALLSSFQALAGQADAAVLNMDFRFLFSSRRQVFHIGYNVSTEQLDPSYYDLLASEARIASLIAIAKGDAPQSQWQAGAAFLERDHV
jgi:hypothetical protein